VSTTFSTGTITPDVRLPASVQTIFDGTNYWAFYVNSAQAEKICYRHSTDFATWSAETTVAATNAPTNAQLFTVIFNASGSPPTLLACYFDTTNPQAKYLLGTISGTTISWGSLANLGGVGQGSDVCSITGTLNNSGVPVLVDARTSGYIQIYTATNALTSSFTDTNWTFVNNGTPYATVCAVLPLASGNKMTFCDDGATAVKYSIFTGSFGMFTVLTSGTGVSRINWSVSGISTSNLAFIGLASASTFIFKTYNGTAWSTATAPSWPTSGIAATQSVALSNDGTNYILSVIRGDANHTISVNIWNGSSWSGWVDQTTDTNAKSNLQAGPTSASAKTADLIWQEGTNPYSIVGAVASTAPAAPTTATLSGATSGYVSIPVTYTITLDQPAGVGGVSCPVACTLGWTVTSSPVVIAQGSTTGTFTVTPTTAATASVSLSATTPSLTLAGTPISVVATVHPSTTATLTGPTKGHPSVASPPFTVTLDYPADQTYTITPASSGSGDTCSPATLTFNIGQSSHTFTVTPGSGTGSRNVTITSSPSLTCSGSPIAYLTAAGSAYTSTKSGNWNDYTVWGGGVPISGDTATIAAGHTVTVPDSYTATIGATGQASNYTALSLNNTGALVIGGGTSGELDLQGDIAPATQTSVSTIVTLSAGSTLRFKPSSGQRIKVGQAINGMVAINGSSAHRCAVLTDATALAGGGLKGYLQGYASVYASGIASATYCDFTDLGDGSTNGMSTSSLSTGQALTLSYSTFTRCEGVHAAMTDAAQSYTISHNYWTASVGTVFDNGRLVNLRLDNSTDKTGGTRLIDSNAFDLMLELQDGRDGTLTNNVWNSKPGTSAANLQTGQTDGKKWASFSGGLFYGTQGDNVNQMTANGDVSNSYFINLNNHYSYSLSATSNTNSTISGCIYENPVGAAENQFLAFGVGANNYTHTVQLNLVLPCQGAPTDTTIGPHLAGLNGWSAPGYTVAFYHNTSIAGMNWPAIHFDETAEHIGWISAYKGNIAWNSTGTSQSAFHLMDTSYKSSGGIVDVISATNADYNATWNSFRSEPGDGQAYNFTGSGTVHTIASCANNGSGLIRVVTNSAHGLSTGNTVYIEGCATTTEANNTAATRWTVTVINSTTVDLQSSTFSHASTGDGRLCTTYPFAGNGYQLHLSGGFAGAHDVADGNPSFVDASRNVGTWYTSPTGANQTATGTYLGDVAAAVAYIAGNPATDPANQIGTRIAACMSWIRAGFRPTTAVLAGASYPGDPLTTDASGNAWSGATPDIGAMAFSSSGSVSGSVLTFLDQSLSGGFSAMGL
jgi:hypothetical protein